MQENPLEYMPPNSLLAYYLKWLNIFEFICASERQSLNFSMQISFMDHAILSFNRNNRVKLEPVPVLYLFGPK